VGAECRRAAGLSFLADGGAVEDVVAATAWR
jgi:hypothetical protein